MSLISFVLVLGKSLQLYGDCVLFTNTKQNRLVNLKSEIELTLNWLTYRLKY